MLTTASQATRSVPYICDHCSCTVREKYHVCVRAFYLVAELALKIHTSVNMNLIEGLY